MKRSLLTLAVLSLPLSFNAMARTTVIPKAVQDLKFLKEIQSKSILKNAKGTIKGSSLEAADTPKNWFNLSPIQGVEGVGSELTYDFLGLPQGEQIIVAVIDSGVDANHEDLQGKMWINKGEIANDGIDNDRNGYIDDIFGWNFIGAKDGGAKFVADPLNGNGIKMIEGDPNKQVGPDTLEVTRQLVRLEKKKASGAKLTKEEQAELESDSKAVNDAVATAQTTVTKYGKIKKNYDDASKVLKAAGVEVISTDSVANFTPSNEDETKAKDALNAFFQLGVTIARVERVLNYYQDQLSYYYNKEFNSRTIVGDNYDDLSEKNYGNNDVIGGDGEHGTHVAGIIAANRANSLGIKGVATNVKIMAVRCVPNGDERDKDVANAIRYAVDNGARVINMSFGKDHSPFKKEAVDEAVKYAAKKGVLLVHAAGNSNQDNNTARNFPNRKLGKNIFGKMKEANNWLEVGASSYQKNENLPATFSNYGSKSVDLFAPGVDILSATPKNTYDTFSGTSMASPATAGVAALLLSYKPKMKAKDVRKLILENARDRKDIDVKLPGEETIVKFGTLSITGSVADVFAAAQSLK
ncbi:MAG: S8 family peptidase [Bacteriovoracaceae bacterium]